MIRPTIALVTALALTSHAAPDSDLAVSEVREVLEANEIATPPSQPLNERVEAAIEAAKALERANIKGEAIRIVEPIRKDGNESTAAQLQRLDLKDLKEKSQVRFHIDETKGEVQVEIPIKVDGPDSIGGHLDGGTAVASGWSSPQFAPGGHIDPGGEDPYVTYLRMQVRQLEQANLVLGRRLDQATSLVRRLNDWKKKHKCETPSDSNE